MKNLLLFLLFISSNAFSQTNPSTFWKNRCPFITDGTGKSMGLKLKVYVPCEWKKTEGERPHIVKNFTYSLPEGNSLMQTLLIQKLPNALSKDDMYNMFTLNSLKELGESFGTFVTGRKLKIDGIDCGEIICKMTREHPVGKLYLNSIIYYFIFKDKMILLTFAASSNNNNKSQQIFNNYKTLFYGLAGSTVFLSKWE